MKQMTAVKSELNDVIVAGTVADPTDPTNVGKKGVDHGQKEIRG
jgi:hypothetical protein